MPGGGGEGGAPSFSVWGVERESGGGGGGGGSGNFRTSGLTLPLKGCPLIEAFGLGGIVRGAVFKKKAFRAFP